MERFFGADSFWPALISKGLRLGIEILLFLGLEFLACPDFKGIKTAIVVLIWSAVSVSGLP